MKLKFIPIAFLGAALVACGGGGGGGSSGGGGGGGTTTLSVTAKVNGVVVAGYPATAASAPTITLTSGQELEVTSTTAAGFGLSANGAVAAVRETSATVYRAVLASTADTTATLAVATLSAPPQGISIPVVVKATQFDAVRPKVGDRFVYSENDTLLNKTTFNFAPRTQLVTVVNADGSWSESYLTPANAAIGVATYTPQGNRTSFTTDAASDQNCDDRGSKFRRFNLEEKLLAFPLKVGATFNGTWVTTCENGATVTARQDETITATVNGYESVKTAAGVFNALRIDEVTTVTNSTNTTLPGGGYKQTVSVWFDPVLGRNIKFSGVRTYNGTPTTDQAASLVETTNIELTSYVKN
jgi:hypothetical protein